MCTAVAVLLHYFFICGYMFILLEALQTLVIVGYVIPKGPLMPWFVNMAIGWGQSHTLLPWAFSSIKSLTCAVNARELKHREGEFNFSRLDPCLPHTKNFCPILYVSVEFCAQENPRIHVFAI